MRLSIELRQKLQVAYKEVYGQKLSDDDAEALGSALVELFGPMVKEKQRRAIDQ
jgi:hypothetical protein